MKRLGWSLIGLLWAAAAAVGLYEVRQPVDPFPSVVVLLNDVGQGSGAVIGPDCVLTARHVADHEGLVIYALDGTVRPAVAVVDAPESDLAKVYVDPNRPFAVPRLPISTRPLAVGERVRIVGTPGDPDLVNCVLPGTVVKVDAETTVAGTRYHNLDVIDAHAAPGCSGGPVLDARGRIVGVCVLKCGELTAAVPMEEWTDANSPGTRP